MWYGTIRRDQSWEPRNAQEFVKGVRDDQVAPDARPRSPNVFIGPLGTNITINAVAGDITINVVANSGMNTNDVLYVMLDNGVNFVVNASSFPSATQITLANPLPWAASFDNSVIDTSVITPANLDNGDP